MNATSLMSVRGLKAVMVAQFFSAAADNILLFGAIALLKSQAYPAWSIPVLQQFFVAAYIVLAAFAGPLADAYPKGRVMLLANSFKFLGALGFLVGINPFVAYGMVGVGAALYSPAKYGILTQLADAQRLVKANGLLEASTIAAILLGAVAGGLLADWSVPGALAVGGLAYVVAGLANLLIPRLPPEHPMERWHPGTILHEFVADVKTLFRDGPACVSMVGTSLFWGAGASLRFVLVAWVPAALAITSNSMPANMNAMVAVGIVLGAAAAARWVSLGTVRRALPAGVLLGLAVIVFAGMNTLSGAFLLLAAIGACGGFFVVPLNALLQERGHLTVGAGRAIAIQNLAENSTMLLAIGAYIGAARAGVATIPLTLGFGAVMTLLFAAVWWWGRRPLSQVRDDGRAVG